MNKDQKMDVAAETTASAEGEIKEFTLTGGRSVWVGPLIVIAIGLAAFRGYIWYSTSHYDLPKLKPYAGAQEDLFAQMKCLVDYTELGKPTPNVQCRFLKNYNSFWLPPSSLDKCLTYSTDNAVAAFDSPKRIEFDFMCEGNDMRAVFPFQNGQYRLQEIGMTFRK